MSVSERQREHWHSAMQALDPSQLRVQQHTSETQVAIITRTLSSRARASLVLKRLYARVNRTNLLCCKW